MWPLLCGAGRRVAEGECEAALRGVERDGVGPHVIAELVRALVPDAVDAAQTSELAADRRGGRHAAAHIRLRDRRVIVHGERAAEDQRGRGHGRVGVGMGVGDPGMRPREQSPALQGLEVRRADAVHP